MKITQAVTFWLEYHKANSKKKYGQGGGGPKNSDNVLSSESA